MAPFTHLKKVLLLKSLIGARRRRQNMQAMMINLMNRRRCRLLRILFLLQLILTGLQQAVAVPIRPRIRSCRRLQRNTGWWNLVWTVYSEKRFKKTFRMTRQTFSLIHDRIKDDLTKESVTEEPIPSQMRLAICLYRLSRGDYYNTIQS